MHGGVSWQGVALLRPEARRWRRVAVPRRLIVGSGEDVDLRLERPGIAARHCRLRPDGDGVLVSALEEGAGTSVGGQVLRGEPLLLRPGQILRVGGLPLVAVRDGRAHDQPWVQIHDLGSGCAGVWQAMATLALAASSDWPVLITGETGTGKELAASLVHGASDRARRPLVALNCAAFNGGTLHAELFGATRGAYTSSVQERRGAFERADGGTVFLDEIGELPAEAQAALLRVLESGEVQVVGGAVRQVDVRLIAATNRDLSAEVSAGRFRADLLHRLAVSHVCLPPLRRRGRDAMVLLERFLGGRSLPPDGREFLQGRPWPGNVRELLNVSRRLKLRVGVGEVLLDDLAACLAPQGHDGEEEIPAIADKTERVARLLVSEPTVSAAWRRSGLSRTTFYRHLRAIRRAAAEVSIKQQHYVIA